MDKPFGLSKKEILRKGRQIGELFGAGESFVAWPFKCLYTISKEREDAGLCVLISVGKKYNKRAVCRNLIKRRSKEAFRLNKHFYHNHTKEFAGTFRLILIYISKEECSYTQIEEGIKKALKNAVEKVNANCHISADPDSAVLPKSHLSDDPAVV